MARMNATQLALHRTRCRDPYCGSCETAAEEQAADDTPNYNTDHAQDAYERWMGL